MVTPEQGLDLEALEGILDRHGIGGIMDMLAEISHAKADHIRENWQDEELANVWDAQGDVLEAFKERMKW